MSCPTGTMYDASSGQCVVCPGGMYYNASIQACQCPVEYPHFNGQQCIACNYPSYWN